MLILMMLEIMPRVESENQIDTDDVDVHLLFVTNPRLCKLQSFELRLGTGLYDALCVVQIASRRRLEIVRFIV